MILRFLGTARLSRPANVCQRRPIVSTSTPVKRHRIKLKWIILGAAATGTGAYTLNLLLPDTRAEYDPQHYYSDWKVSAFG
jgi:hypothetical protein